MEKNGFKNVQLALIELLSSDKPSDLSTILNLIIKFPKLPEELVSVGLAEMKYSNQKNKFEPPMFPPKSMDSFFYWTGKPAMPLNLIRVDKNGFRNSYLTITSNDDAKYFMDDARDSSIIHKDGKSLVITHSDTDYGYEDFLEWLKTRLLVMVFPYGVEYKG